MPKVGDRIVETYNAPFIGRENEPAQPLRQGIVYWIGGKGSVHARMEDGGGKVWASPEVFERGARVL